MLRLHPLVAGALRDSGAAHTDPREESEAQADARTRLEALLGACNPMQGALEGWLHERLDLPEAPGGLVGREGRG